MCVCVFIYARMYVDMQYSSKCIPRYNKIHTSKPILLLYNKLLLVITQRIT